MEEDHPSIPNMVRRLGAIRAEVKGSDFMTRAVNGGTQLSSLANRQDRQVRNASKAWATRIPTLRTMKNAAIASNMDKSRAMDSTKGSAVCTVKKIPWYETNFLPR
jgi:hypothetical protein